MRFKAKMYVTVLLRILLSFAKILRVPKLQFVLIVLIASKLAVFRISRNYKTQKLLSFEGPYY